MSQNRFWNLFAKKLSGEAMPDEVAELEILMKENPEWVYEAEQVEQIWKLKFKEERYDAELAFEQHLDRQKKNGLELTQLLAPVDLVPPVDTRPRFGRMSSYSLIILVLFLIGGLVWYNRSGKPAEISHQKAYSEVSTQLASKTKLVLPDSTVVWLNAGSRLIYNEKFGITNRNTTLTGEAYFEVKKSTIPFTIHANTVDIKVLGTAFNVKAYPDEKTTETSLVRGRIEITMEKRPGEKFILKPNEKLIVSNGMKEENTRVKEKSLPIVTLRELSQTPDHTIIETSWVENKLIFQDESFEEIARKMERWYNYSIDIRDEKIASLRFTGVFEKETIKQALEALQITSHFNFIINQNKITITR